MDEPQLPEKAAWTSRFRNWRDAFKQAPRMTMLLDNVPDIELGTNGRPSLDGHGGETD